MKKFLTFIFTILSAFVVFALTLSFKASASESGITMMNGAQVRTAEDTDAKQGIKFSASVTELPEGSTHGFYAAKGEFTAAELLAELENSGVKSEENPTGVVSDFAVTGTNTTFSVVLYGIPETDYLQDITVLAYVKLAGGEVEIAEESVTRNLAEVAIYNAKGELANNKLISEVVTALNDDYKTTVLDGEGNLVVTGFNVQDLGALEALFVADLNAFAGETVLTLTSTNTEWHNALTSSIRTDLSDGLVYTFFQDAAMKAKWAWVLNFMLDKYAAAEGENETQPHVVNQIRNVVLAGQPVYDASIHNVQFNGNANYALTTHGCEHLIGSLYNFFNQSALNTGTTNKYVPLKYGTAAAYEGVEEFNTVAYFQLADMTKVGETIEVPAAPKAGYIAKWTLNGSDYAEETYTLTAEDVKFVPLYTTVSYSITFFNGENELTSLGASYNIETSYVLPTEITGATLLGWYDNPELEGNPVTEIAVGNTGNKEFYAKVATKSAEIVVDATLTEENNTTEFDGNTYTLGIDAYATIEAAVEAAAEGDRIYVKAGTYAETFTLSKSNLTFLGANKGVKATADRTEGTILTGSITLAQYVKNITFNGINFIENAEVVNTPLTTSGYAYNNENISFENCYVNTTNGRGFLYFKSTTAAYSKDISFDNCYFTGSSKSGHGIIYINNSFNVSVTNSIIENLTFDNATAFVNGNGDSVRNSGFIYIDDAARGLSGDLIFTNNVVNGVTGSSKSYNIVIHVNYIGRYSGSTTPCDIIINNNSFNEINGFVFNVEACNSTVSGKYVAGTLEMNYNEFNNCHKIAWIDIATAGTTTFSFNYNKVVKGSYHGYVVKCSNLTVNASNNIYLDTEGTVLDYLAADFNAGVNGEETYFTSLEDYEAAING